MSKKDDMSIVSLLVRSKKRIKVLKSLEKEDKIPSKIFTPSKKTLDCYINKKFYMG